MIKDSNNFPVLYWIAGSAAACPKCGNGNAMLDTHKPGVGDQWIRGFECRDCGFSVSESKQTSVTIKMDNPNRVYHATASDGTEVDLAGYDDALTNRPSIRPLMNYLKHHPTPDTW